MVVELTNCGLLKVDDLSASVSSLNSGLEVFLARLVALAASAEPAPPVTEDSAGVAMVAFTNPVPLEAADALDDEGAPTDSDVLEAAGGVLGESSMAAGVAAGGALAVALAPEPELDGADEVAFAEESAGGVDEAVVFALELELELEVAVALAVELSVLA